LVGIRECALAKGVLAESLDLKDIGFGDRDEDGDGDENMEML
jgi:hypothetical protein